MKPRRVVVSGIGLVSALGADRESFWSALTGGRSGIAPLTGVDPAAFHFTHAAQVRDFDPHAVLDAKLVRQTDRFCQFALVAAQRALEDAGLDPAGLAQRRCGVVVGSSIGGQVSQDESFVTLYREDRPRLNPATIVKVMPNAAASQITIQFAIPGPSYTVSAACSSSNSAIGQAFWHIRSGLIDMALAGGSEAPFSYGYLKAWDAMRVVSPTTCRPFSLGRDGMILGEGGAILVLETAEAAQERGAHIYAEIAGFGMSSDASHLVQPSPEGAARAMAAALGDAGLVPEQVTYINAHGTGTLANDESEVAAIRLAFGRHADRLAVSATKSMHGHALGAAGALEAVATVLAIDRRIMPPTANYQAPDPACVIDVVPNTARPAEIEAALSNSFAFGGMNAVLAFRRWP
jgi:nodulation protein E